MMLLMVVYYFLLAAWARIASCSAALAVEEKRTPERLTDWSTWLLKRTREAIVVDV